jgi:hypothetical protein
MTESNKLTVTYDTPKKSWAIIESDYYVIGNVVGVYDTYDEALKKCHALNNQSNISNIYTVYESVYYTGSVKAKYYGMEFETNLDNGDME